MVLVETKLPVLLIEKVETSESVVAGGVSLILRVQEVAKEKETRLQ
jgi:hypothetical protein